MGASSPDRNAASGRLGHDTDDAQPFLIIKSRSLGGGAAGNQKIDAAGDLPFHQRTQCSFVDWRLRACVRRKRSDQSRAATS